MMLTFEQAGHDWLNALPAKRQRRRKNQPLAPTTIKVYGRAFARLSGQLGSLPLEEINNKVLKAYVDSVRDDYSPVVVSGDLKVAHAILSSITDHNGDFVHAIKINHDYLQTPAVNPDDAHAPCATREECERGVAQPGAIAGIIAVGAGCGLRISEILALRVNDVDGTDDCYDLNSEVIHVRRTLKTPSAKRSVYLAPDLNEFLVRFVRREGRNSGESMFDVSRSATYRQLADLGLPPMHAYRRFFATHADEAGMNEQTLKMLMGHSKGGDITTRYKHSAKNVDFVRAEIVRCGLGFTLPASLVTVAA